MVWYLLFRLNSVKCKLEGCMSNIKTFENPVISGKWKTLLHPWKFGHYVNDHTLYKDHEGKWHLIGITSKEGKPDKERYFTHAMGSSLKKPMQEVCKVINTGTLAWAPCVVYDGDKYYMFYGPSPTKLAVSNDSIEWFGYSVIIENEPPTACHRDHFVMKLHSGEWIMYVSGVVNKKSAISYLLSNDLLHWKYGGVALQGGENSPLNPAWGAMESPYVVERNGNFYLFVTYTDCSKATYNKTMVFASADAKNFGEYNGEKGAIQPIAILTAHAPEIVCENGEYYITTCGWKNLSIGHGKVLIAPLLWE